MPELRIEGKDDGTARAAEAALRTLLRDEFGTAAATRVVEPEADATRDLMAVAALALSIPGGVIAAMDLAQRLKLVPKLRRLIGLASEQQALGVRLLIDVGDGVPRPLDHVTPEQILDAVARLERER